MSMMYQSRKRNYRAYDEKIYQVYNDGIIELNEKTNKKDKYNTVIRGQFDLSVTHREWFRNLGITAEDVYYASADDKTISMKVAVRGKIRVNPQWVAVIDEVKYSIYRFYFNPKRNETEISLVVIESG